MSSLSWCEIDHVALRHNLDVFAALVGGLERLLPVVKANAYGHGVDAVVPTLVEAGVRAVGVNDLCEALAIRERWPELDVLVLGFAPPEDLSEAVRAGVALVVYRADVLEALDRLGRAHDRPARVHLKVETGVHRQGLAGDELLSLAAKAAAAPGVSFEGLGTHFADIEDTTDPRFAQEQLARFTEATEALAARGLRPSVRHAANTAATLNLPETHFDMARVGIGLYGMWPSQETFIFSLAHDRVADLRPALTWKCRIAQIKDVPRGGYIGYGRTFRATADLRLAVLPVGYYDGYDRRLSNMAHVLIRGLRAPVRGRVCMNMTLVDVTDVPGVSLDDEVVLLGRSGDEAVRAEDLAAIVGSINYEITTRISERLPRRVTGATGG
jgi:alanine racemase